MTHLAGDATFTNINIGQDASDLSNRGQLGGFGQAADNVEIDNLGPDRVGDHGGHVHPAEPRPEPARARGRRPLQVAAANTWDPRVMSVGPTQRIGVTRPLDR